MWLVLDVGNNRYVPLHRARLRRGVNFYTNCLEIVKYKKVQHLQQNVAR